jgi:hypothetical protein
LINGSQVTLTGAPGTVVIQVSQAGNAAYSAAPSVTFSFTVTATAPLVYFGTAGGGTSGSSVPLGLRPDTASSTTNFAANVAPDYSSGTAIGYFPAINVGFAVSFTPNASGSFSTTTAAITGTSSPGRTLTVTGQVAGSAVTGSIVELGASFTATLDAPSGPTAPIAGLYQGASVETSSGTTYAVVGTQNDVYVLAVTPAIVTGGSGTVSNNTFSVSATQSTTVAGSINPATTTVSGTVTTPASTTAFSGLESTTTRTDRLINLSSRGFVGTGSNLLIAGFVIGGPNPKPVLLRAAGPALSGFGVSGVLAKPVLQLFDGNGNLLQSNLGWNSDPALAATFSQVGAFPFAYGSADAALATTLQPGTYTMQVSGSGGATGAAIAEIYDASINPQSVYQKLVNISSRGMVSTAAGNLIGGFIITGNSPKTVLIRGVGPTLQSLFGLQGSLPDPLLAVYDSGGNLIAQNDNWGTPVTVLASQTAASAASIAAAAATVGAFSLPSGSLDSSVIVTLAPGAYSAQVSGVSGASGIALVEIYEIAP